MKASIIIESGVAWLVDEDDRKLLYFYSADQIDDLRASCAFAVQELDEMEKEASAVAQVASEGCEGER